MRNEIIISPEAEKRLMAVTLEIAGGPGKRAAFVNRWLREGLRQGRWKAEEIDGTVVENVRRFYELRDSFSEESRNLLRCRKLADLRRLVKAENVSQEETAAKRSDQMLWLYKDPDTGLKLGMPCTMATAQKYGRNTTWCVSATEGQNYFWSHSLHAPLLFIICPGDEKFIWALDCANFRTATNQPIKETAATDLVGRFPQLPVLLGDWARRLLDMKAKVRMPTQTYNEALFLTAVRAGRFDLLDAGDDPIDEAVPAACASPPIVSEPLERLERMNNQTQAKYLEAVRQNASAIKIIPLLERTREICLEAVLIESRLLDEAVVPAHLLNSRFAEDALSAAVHRATNSYDVEKIGHLAVYLWSAMSQADCQLNLDPIFSKLGWGIESGRLRPSAQTPTMTPLGLPASGGDVTQTWKLTSWFPR